MQNSMQQEAVYCCRPAKCARCSVGVVVPLRTLFGVVKNTKSIISVSLLAYSLIDEDAGLSGT